MTVLAPPFGPIPAAPCGPLKAGEIMTRPCACGTPVTASRLDPWPGVAAHNATAVHTRWWACVRGQWQGEERP